jgi:hypothetical protein
MVGDEQPQNVRALMRDPIALPAQADGLAGLFLDGLLLVRGELVYPLLKAIRLWEGNLLRFGCGEITLSRRPAN